jgi:hypothetical protein
MRVVFLAVLMFLSGCVSTSVAADEQARKIYVVTQQVRAEVFWTRSRHTEFDLYRDATFRYLKIYPSLLVEEAFCIVTNEQSDVCETARNAVPVKSRSALPPSAIQILKEDIKGSFVPVFDEQTGFPVFEVNGVEYTAIGPVGRTALLHQEPEKHKTEANRVSEIIGRRLLGPVDFDTYGPGLHSDATGRPFEFRTRTGRKVYGPVEIDGYGLGVHRDEYGRPVRAVPKH